MKIISYTPLHYGADYLASAIRSVIDHVDECWILYAAEGSHGHRTDVKCPDSRARLLSIAQLSAGPKLRWVDGDWTSEGDQRESIHQHAPDADVILALDADEIWPETPDYPGGLRSILESMLRQTKYHRFRWPMVHFWRSFHRAILHDPAFPERVIIPRNTGGDVDVMPAWNGRQPPIAHMGYAQRPAIVQYKQHTHGHKGEWRQDNWFENVFMANAQTNCHPVGSEYWNPESVNPADYMPSFMSEHPYWGKDVIE